MSDEADIKAGVESAGQESQQLCSQGNFLKALQVAVAAPSGSKEAAVRDQAATAVAAVIGNIKDADVAKILGDLTEQQRDALMKYIYRAMSLNQNCTKLLQWHEKLYEKDGAGIIMRSLVDRKING